MVSEQLQRHYRDQWLQHLRNIRYIEDIFSHALDVLIAFRRHRNDVSTAATHFLNIRKHLLVLAVTRSNKHAWHAIVNQRDRSMLHLRAGHALCVDVTDFLEFQRAFQGHRVVHAAAKE